MISTSWSTPESPGKIGCPSSSSASTQPALHTSTRKVSNRTVKQTTSRGYDMRWTYQFLWCNLWHQRSTLVLGSTASRCTTRSVRRVSAAWRCQNRIASVRPSPDRAADSGALYHDGKYRASGYRRDFWTAGTCRAETKIMRGQLVPHYTCIKRIRERGHTYSDKIDWYRLFIFSIITSHFVNGFWNIFEH